MGPLPALTGSNYAIIGASFLGVFSWWPITVKEVVEPILDLTVSAQASAVRSG